MIVYGENKEYTTTSRYKVLRVIREEQMSQDYLETYNQVVVPKVEGKDSYHIVKESEVNRLDLIANKYYGSPTYWWAIALANGFIDPFVLNEGVMVRIPSLDSLSSYGSRILVR